MNVLSLFSGCGGMDIGFEGNFKCLRRSVNVDLHPDWIVEGDENGKFNKIGKVDYLIYNVPDSKTEIYVKSVPEILNHLFKRRTIMAKYGCVVCGWIYDEEIGEQIVWLQSLDEPELCFLLFNLYFLSRQGRTHEYQPYQP